MFPVSVANKISVNIMWRVGNLAVTKFDGEYLQKQLLHENLKWSLLKMFIKKVDACQIF